MKIGIINIGDELLAGKILNTNQFDLSQLLTPLGHEIIFAHVVADDISAIIAAVKSSTQNASLEILILTGGLGPTQDDLTREAIARLLETELIQDSQALRWLGNYFRKDPAELPDGQKNQAMVPNGARGLHNSTGTACGIGFTYQNIPVYVFPGVPSELKIMTREHVIPQLKSDKILMERSVWTMGWSEGSQREAFANIDLNAPFHFSSLPNVKGVRLSLSCMATIFEKEFLETQLEKIWSQILTAIPTQALIDQNGASLVETIFNGLTSRAATVSVAESCTGGMLGALLTEQPGSSKIFQQGFLTYSNKAKMELLGVEAKILADHGAVSEATVNAMALGCLSRSGADYAIAITGIAGPDGGTAEKPVGTVWIAVAAKNRQFNSEGHSPILVAKCFQLRGNRAEVRSRSCYVALNQLRLVLATG